MNPHIDFFTAVEAGDLSNVEAMLAADPSVVHARNTEGATALHLAAFHAHRQLVELLCAAGGDINARDRRFGATPAGWALHYLRERGAFLAIEIDDLLHAVRSHDIEWTRRLIQRHPHIVATKDADGRPLSECARECGVPEIARLFDSPPADG
jgi:Ankyrin repeats (3 copies)